VFGGVGAVGAREHAGELRDGLPPGGQGDDQEDQVGGVEVVVEEAVALGGGEGLDLALVVGSAVDLVGSGSAGQAFPLQQPGQFGVGGVVVEGVPGELADVLQIRSGRGYRSGEIAGAPLALALAADVSDEAAVSGAAAEVDAAWGRVDALINNAGWMPGRQPVLELELSVLERVLRSNLIGSFLATKHFAPLMIRGGGGRIIYLSSVMGAQPGPGGAPYGGSKAAINILANVVHQEGTRHASARLATQLTGRRAGVSAPRPDG
jgi:short chain dehydrogenase